MRKSSLLIFLLFSVFCFGQTTGYMGKRNQIGIDLVDLSTQTRINLEYRYALKPRLSLTSNIGLQASNNDLDEYKSVNGAEADYITYGSYKGKSASAGIGMTFSTKRIGIEMPLGNYFGFNVQGSSAMTTETVDSLNLSYDYSSTNVSLAIVFGENFYLTKNLTIDLGLMSGITFGTIESRNTKRPASTMLPELMFITVGSGELGSNYVKPVLFPRLFVHYIF